MYFNPRLLIVFLLGFASGVPFRLTGSTLSAWLTESNLSLTSIGLFSLVIVPYNFKVLWAPLMDRLRIPFLSPRLGHRRSWIIVVEIALVGALIALGRSDPAQSLQLTALAAVIVAFFSASQDIAIDAYRIEVLDDEQQGAGAAMAQAGYLVGMNLCGGAGALDLSTVAPWSTVYSFMAAAIGVGIFAALIAPTPTRSRVATAPATTTSAAWLRRTFLEPVQELISRRGIHTALFILGFVLLYKLGDAFAHVMATPFYLKIGFTKDQIGYVTNAFGMAATLSGVFLGGWLVKRAGVLKCLILGSLVQMASNLMFVVQASVGNDLHFLFATISVENLSGGIGSAAFVAYLSRLSNTAYTGTQYALFTSLMAFGRAGLAAPSGWLAHSVGWTNFFLVSTVLGIPGIVLAVYMVRRLPLEHQLPVASPDSMP